MRGKKKKLCLDKCPVIKVQQKHWEYRDVQCCKKT